MSILTPKILFIRSKYRYLSIIKGILEENMDLQKHFTALQQQEQGSYEVKVISLQ